MDIWMEIRVHWKHWAIQIKFYCVWAHHHRIRPMRNSRLPLNQDPFHEQFIFQINKQNMCCYCMRSNDQIRSQFFTCHDSSAVMPCRQICNLIRYLELNIEQNKVLQDFMAHNTFVGLMCPRSRKRKKSAPHWCQSSHHECWLTVKEVMEVCRTYIL